jgi:hypothetical protein
MTAALAPHFFAGNQHCSTEPFQPNDVLRHLNIPGMMEQRGLLNCRTEAGAKVDAFVTRAMRTM